jgi:hypothetical protein
MNTIIRALIVALLLPLASFAQKASDVQFWRPYDKRGINVFETGKADTVAYDGLTVRVGANFTQQFQSLSHETGANPRVVAGVNQNQLIQIGNGFNLATANLNFDVALEDGVRLNLIAYLSSRHHNETWVKGGYIQADKLSFLKIEALDKLMENLTIKVGHMEINYGDAHFRRSDNGNAMYNPLVGNLIMDAFTTETAAEVYFQKNGILAMVAASGGEIQGGIIRPDDRAPNFYGKLGYDKQINDQVRVRLTGSVYTTKSSARNTLYGGDRAGSRYYLVMENTTATPAAQFTSGRFNPNQTDNITAMVFNPFVKFAGFELFGNFEQSKGKAANETEDRTFNQMAVEGLYRFGANENFYFGGRYNTIKGRPAGYTADIQIDRIQIGAGWFATKNVLTKIEYVSQEYKDFLPTDIRHKGKFNGLMIEGIVAF